MSFDGLRNLLKKSKEGTRASTATTSSVGNGTANTGPVALDPYTVTITRLRPSLDAAGTPPSATNAAVTGTRSSATGLDDTTERTSPSSSGGGSALHDDTLAVRSGGAAVTDKSDASTGGLGVGVKRPRSRSPPEGRVERATGQASESRDPVVEREVKDAASGVATRARLSRTDFSTWRAAAAVALDAALNAIPPTAAAVPPATESVSEAVFTRSSHSSIPVPTLRLPCAVRRFLAQCLDRGLAEVPDEGGMLGMKDALVLQGLQDLQHTQKTAPVVPVNREEKEEWEDDAVIAILPEDVIAGISAQLGVLRSLADLCHTIWFLLAAQWRAALLGQLSTTQTRDAAGQRVEGWSFPVYRYVLDRTISAEDRPYAAVVVQSAESWQDSCRQRERAFQLLACVFSDYCQVRRAVREGAQRAISTSSASRDMIHILTQELTAAASDEACIVPTALRNGLHRLLVEHLQSEDNSVAARQDYTDITQGNANWKLGLFSGGEVHMRRSMERVERNRIYHLLNNERAMGLLHVVRLWIAFYEVHMSDRYKKIFRRAIGSSASTAGA